MSAPAERYLEFIHLPSYRRSAGQLFGDETQRRIEQTLVDNPAAGAVIVGTGGVRKLRVALPGGGRSGGARVIYFVRRGRGRIYLLLAYPNNEKDDLTNAERNLMRQLTSQLEGEQ